MKQFVFGFFLSLACVSWGVIRHDDGSVTFDHEELDTLRVQFYSLQASVVNCRILVEKLQGEAAEMNKGRL